MIRIILKQVMFINQAMVGLNLQTASTGSIADAQILGRTVFKPTDSFLSQRWFPFWGFVEWLPTAR